MFSLLEIHLNEFIGFMFFVIDHAYNTEEDDSAALLGIMYDREEKALFLDFLFLDLTIDFK